MPKSQGFSEQTTKLPKLCKKACVHMFVFLISACLPVCSTLRQRADPVYSPPLQISGLCWRLKVYPVSDFQDADTFFSSISSCPGRNYILSRHIDGSCVPEQLRMCRSVQRSRSCAGFPLVAQAFRNDCAVCRLHAPPSVKTCRLCCLKPSMAWLR